MMGECKRQASDGEERETGESKRQANDGVETCRRDTRMRGEANDGEEQERHKQLTGEANDGEEQERQANDGRVQEAGE